MPGCLNRTGGAAAAVERALRANTVVRRLAHEPLGWRPTTLEVVVRRYRCTGCAHVWRPANDAVLAEGRRVLIDDAGRCDGVTVIGVDEHVWRHTRRGDKCVTVIIDLTSVRNGTGPSRLLFMSKDAPSRPSRPGWVSGPTPGATGSRSSRWTSSPGSRPPRGSAELSAATTNDVSSMTSPGTIRSGSSKLRT